VPEDQDQVVTRRRARRQGTAAQPEQLPLEARKPAAAPGPDLPATWAATTDAVGPSFARDTAAEQTDAHDANTPAPSRRRPGRPRRNATAEAAETQVSADSVHSTTPPATAAASAVETAHQMNSLDTVHPEETAESASVTQMGNETPRRARGPRISRPRGARTARAADPGADTAAVNELVVPVENAANDALAGVPADEALATDAPRPRRGRRAARPAAETIQPELPPASATEAAASAAGTMARPTTPAAEAPATIPVITEQPTSLPVRNPYRFGRSTRADEAATASAPEARTEMRAEPIAPSPATEPPATGSPTSTPEPASADASAHEGAPTPESTARPYRRFDRVMPHVPGGNDPYRRRGQERGQEQGVGGRQGQQGGCRHEAFFRLANVKSTSLGNIGSDRLFRRFLR